MHQLDLKSHGLGIDVLLQPAWDYSFVWGTTSFGWVPKEGPGISVSLDPPFDALAVPCGPTPKGGETHVEVRRRALPYGVSVQCEVHDAVGTPKRRWIVRARRNIDRTIVCSFGATLDESDEVLADKRAVCESLQVIGRSPYRQPPP